MKVFTVSRLELDNLKMLIAKKKKKCEDAKKARILAFAETFGIFFTDCKLIVVA